MAIGMTFLYALQFIQSDHIPELWTRIIIKLPFVLFALAALYAQPMSKETFHLILKVYVGMVGTVSVFMFINYLMNFEAFNHLYAESSVMPGLMNHIRFSIMLAFAAYIAYYLLFNVQSFKLGTFGRNVFLCMLVFLIVFTHVYSVRGGLIAFYSLVLFEISRKVFNKGNGKKYLIYGLLIGVVLVISVFTVPTLRNKMNITFEELQQYADGRNLNHNSIGKRLASYEIAWSIFKESPLLGCGIGDYEMLNKQMFNQRYPEVEVPILAHNQFLYFLAASGIVGLFIFCFTLFYAIIHTRVKYPRLFTAHLVVLFVSFQTEPMLETQLGVAYSVLFWILPLCVNQRTENPAVINQ